MVQQPAAWARTLQAGMAHYRKGNCARAEQALQAALQTSQSPRQRAHTYKYLGICQFRLNKKTAAMRSFRQALRLVPSYCFFRAP